MASRATAEKRVPKENADCKVRRDAVESAATAGKRVPRASKGKKESAASVDTRDLLECAGNKVLKDSAGAVVIEEPLGLVATRESVVRKESVDNRACVVRPAPKEAAVSKDSTVLVENVAKRVNVGQRDLPDAKESVESVGSLVPPVNVGLLVSLRVNVRAEEARATTAVRPKSICSKSRTRCLQTPIFAAAYPSCSVARTVVVKAVKRAVQSHRSL